MSSHKGPKLVYFEIFERLDDEVLYSLFMVRKFAVNQNLLRPGPDDIAGIDPKKLEDRFRCALVRANNPNYGGRRLPEADGVVKNGGRIVDAWFGATIKLFLVDQLPEDKARLQSVRKKLIRRQEGGRLRPMLKRSRLWLAVAIATAATFAAPPVRDVFETLYEDGVAAAQRLAYSFTPETPEHLFQQAWVDYRAGDYEASMQKGHLILANQHISQHLRANCWYLLGHLDWQVGSSEAALVNLDKAYDLYQSSDDHANLYATSLAMAKASIELGNLPESRALLTTSLTHYEDDGGARIEHLGRYHSVALDLAAAENDYEKALQFAIRRHEIFQGSDQIDTLADVTSDLGFWFAVNGCTESGQQYTVQAEKLIFHLRDESRHIANQVNWILIDRLHGFKTDLLAVGSIQEWFKIREDSRVEFYLDLALNLELSKEGADDVCNPKIEPD